MANDQGVPNWNQPMVGPGGIITQSWRQFLVSLWNRTGGGTASGTFVTGDTKITFAPGVQPGWLDCDGSEVSRTAYAALFLAIGTTYGPGDGVTTFNLPNASGRTLVGADGVTYNLGDTGGASQVTLTTAQLPPHAHAVSDPGHTHTAASPPHAHSIDDPGHAHAIEDPGHDHTSLEPADTNTAGAAGGDATPGTTGSSTTGISVQPATTGIAVLDTAVTVTVDPEFTYITVDDTGDGDPVDILPPYTVARVLIKT